MYSLTDGSKNATQAAAFQEDSLRADRTILIAGLILLIMEICKQLYLYFVYFQGSYNVWYVSFQLCSLPMYLSVFYGLSGLYGKKSGRLSHTCAATETAVHIQQTRGDSRLSYVRAVTAAFMRDFGALGGIAALIVHDGFTYPGHPFLTAHGYIWHIMLLTIAFYVQCKGLYKIKVTVPAGSVHAADYSTKRQILSEKQHEKQPDKQSEKQPSEKQPEKQPDVRHSELSVKTEAAGGKTAAFQTIPFRAELWLFGGAACIAELINVALSRYGDCDMFYISPYHLSSQPVFHQIDAVIGRPAGILLYLCCVAFGGYVMHRFIPFLVGRIQRCASLHR